MVLIFMIKIGKKYNKLTAIKEVGSNKHKRKNYLFKCECGNEKIILGDSVEYEHTKSCGCAHKDAANKKIKILQNGSKYGKLTILKHLKYENKHHIYLCKCNCGNIVKVYGCHLQSGHTKSCGCIVKEQNVKKLTTHGLSADPLYIIWCGIKNRCNDKNAPNYKYYGGRGISVCDEWLHNFKAFYDWANENGYEYREIYKDKLTIDRIDVNGNYEPNNCKWADWKTQNNNKRSL